MATTVWAFEPLEELGGETGFLSVDDDKLAEKLIKSGAVQDPAVGALELKHIVSAPAGGGYRTREMKADNGKSRGGKGDKDDPPADDKKKPAKGK